MTRWYGISWSDAVRILNSDTVNGLTLSKVQELTKLGASNKTIHYKNKNVTYFLINALKYLWTILLLITINCSIFFYNGQNITGICILIITFISIFVIVKDDYKEGRSLKEIEKLNPTYARVLRQRQILKVSSEELVPGDIVFIEKDDIVPADLRIIESDTLRVKETAITGENYIVEKYETKIEEKELSLGEMKNILFKSSQIIGGSGTGIVISTGMNTEISKTIKMMLNGNENINDFKKRFYSITNILNVVAMIFFLLTLIIDLYVDADFKGALKLANTNAFAFLPLTRTLVLFLIFFIIQKILERDNVKLKDVSVLEDYVKINALMIEQIGAFTEYKMTVKNIYTNDKLIEIEDKKLSERDENIERILSISSLCNDSKAAINEYLNIRMKLMEDALYDFGETNSIVNDGTENQYNRILQMPFDGERRIMTVINRVTNKKNIKCRANIKGALDILFNNCTHILKNGVEKEIEATDIEMIKNCDIFMCNKGLSVIGFAYRNFTYVPTTDENIESNLVFVGLVGFENSIKKEAYEAIEFCRLRNIRPVIITEDNILTASSFGKKLGIIAKGDIGSLSGVEIENMTDEELKKSMEKIYVFSRVNIDSKIRILKTLKDMGYNIAAVGHRVIELPYLRSSNISISVGRKCSSIVQKMTHMWSEDKDYLRLLSLIDESNRILKVILKIILYICYATIFQAGFVMLGLLLGCGLPLEASKILWLNLNMIVPIIALAVQYKEEEIEAKAYKIDKTNVKRLFDKNVFINISILMVICFVGFYIENKIDVQKSQTIALASLIFTQNILIYLFSKKILIRNRISNLLILANIVIQTILLLLTDINSVLQTANLDFHDWSYIARIILAEIAWMVMAKFVKNKKD